MRLQPSNNRPGRRRIHPDTPEQNQIRQHRMERYYHGDQLKAWAHAAYANAKQRAKHKEIAFDLTSDALYDLAKKTETCPILGVELEYYRGRGNRRRANAASIDRVDNDGGYTLDNIAIISQRANGIKSRLTIQELLALGRYAEINYQEAED